MYTQYTFHHIHHKLTGPPSQCDLHFVMASQNDDTFVCGVLGFVFWYLYFNVWANEGIFSMAFVAIIQNLYSPFSGNLRKTFSRVNLHTTKPTCTPPRIVQRTTAHRSSVVYHHFPKMAFTNGSVNGCWQMVHVMIFDLDETYNAFACEFVVRTTLSCRG